MIQSRVMSQIKGRAEKIYEKFNSIDDAVELSYRNVIFPTLILLAGFAMSVSQLAMEMVWAIIRKRRPTGNREGWK